MLCVCVSMSSVLLISLSNSFPSTTWNLLVSLTEEGLSISLTPFRILSRHFEFALGSSNFCIGLCRTNSLAECLNPLFQKRQRRPLGEHSLDFLPPESFELLHLDAKCFRLSARTTQLNNSIVPLLESD